MVKFIRLYPFKMYAEFTDGYCAEFGGQDEGWCIQSIADAQEEHGECTWYTGVNDDHYYDGELMEETI